MEFLKRHYEKIILCLVLLGLAGAAMWMKAQMTPVPEAAAPVLSRSKSAPLVPINQVTDQLALAQITNPPPIILSGEQNLFNPVTWKRKPNGELIKIFKSGPEALTVVDITTNYTIVSYDRSGGSNIYVMTFQQHADPAHPGRKRTELAKKDEKTKSGLYIIRGIKGAPEDPTDLDLEIPETGETVSVSKDKPYMHADSYIADLKYDPELRTLPKTHVNDTMTLDGEVYKVVEITGNSVRVQSSKTTKVSEIKWKQGP